MKKILVPCDFTSTSVQAFRFACEIASQSKGEVFLLNIVELPNLPNSLFVPVQAYESSFLKELKAKANKNFEKLKEQWSGKVKVHLTVEQGSVESGINKFVAKKKIDLVVMGTHGSSGLREYTIGSNTEKIVRAAAVPVIAVKKSSGASSVKNIIFPTDLGSEQKKLLVLVKALQSFFKAKLHVLFVNTPANFNRDIATDRRLSDFAKQHQLKNYTLNIYNDIDEENGIINFSSHFKNKIIAMPTHGRKGLSHLFSGSITEDVVNHIDCPIWTFSER
jgi:nucleotide-binding universal stress UspA family protein